MGWVMYCSKLIFVFLTLFCGASADGTSSQVVVIEGEKPVISSSTCLLFTHLNKGNIGKSSASGQERFALEKGGRTPYTTFRQLSGTKRGKNRVLLPQNFQAPCRTVLITVLNPKEPTDLLVFLTQNSLFFPESLQTIFNKDLYTIASRV